MSRVFLAHETALGRKVVVKVLRSDLVEGLSAERFKREVRLAARLQHAHIVPLLASGSLLRKAEGADLSRPAEAPGPGRDHPGMVGDIISERWAELSRNGWAASFRNRGRLAPESAA